MTGRYRFQCRTSQEASSEHNDTWVRFLDSDLIAERTNGSDTRNLGNSWTKAYTENSTNQWGWTTSTVDNDAHSMYSEFDSAGDYRMQLPGRSCCSRPRVR